MRRVLAVVLALAMLLSLCACGDNDSQTTDPSNSSQATADGAEKPTDGTEGTTGATQAPTGEPTTAPTDEPTTAPTDEPTTAPTDQPTTAPTDEPTTAPTDEPTTAPTDEPTQQPVTQPSTEPTQAPTEAPCSHTYQDATCTAPKTCTKCGATSGSAAGHSYKDATCTAPKTCPKCGATSGSAAGHSYKDATCTAPKTCSKCGATSGSAAGHSYKDATCTAPKTCSKCGATEGSALGHNYVDGVCSRCGQPQENYHPLDSGAWSTLVGSSYSITLSMERHLLDIWYGGDIDQFDSAFREELISDYQNGYRHVKLINGKYYYFGMGDGGGITYTVNENIISVNCEDYIWLTLERIAGDQLKIIAQEGVSSRIVGAVLTWNKCIANEYSTTDHLYKDGVCACGARQLGVGKWHKYHLSGSVLDVTELDEDGIMCYNYLDIETGDQEKVQQGLAHSAKTLTYQGRTYVVWTGAGDDLDFVNISDTSITATLCLGPDTELQKCVWKRISDNEIMVTEVTESFWGLKVGDVFTYVE